MNIKISVTLLLFMSSLLLSSLGCTSAATRSQLKEDSVDFETEGWLDDNTFQVRAIGAPSPTAKGFVKRRTQSAEAALLSAQKRVVELLVGASVTGASGSEDGESTGVRITKELQGHIKGGAIVKKSYDSEDNCEVTYRIQREGLKQLAENVVK